MVFIFHKRIVTNFKCRKATEGPLLEKKRNLEQSLFSLYPEASGKLVKMKMETESVLAEIKTRYFGCYFASLSETRCSKIANRYSYSLSTMITCTKIVVLLSVEDMI